MRTMCEIGAALDSAQGVSVDSICAFIDYLVSENYTQFGGQLLLKTDRCNAYLEHKPTSLRHVRQILSDNVLDDLGFELEYNNTTLGSKFAASKTDQLAKEVERAGTDAVIESPENLAAIDIYTSIGFAQQYDVVDGRCLGWHFTIGGDGYVLEMDVLEKHLMQSSPCFVQIRSAMERIFNTTTHIVCLTS